MDDDITPEQTKRMMMLYLNRQLPSTPDAEPRPDFMTETLPWGDAEPRDVGSVPSPEFLMPPISQENTSDQYSVEGRAMRKTSGVTPELRTKLEEEHQILPKVQALRDNFTKQQLSEVYKNQYDSPEEAKEAFSDMRDFFKGFNPEASAKEITEMAIQFELERMVKEASGIGSLYVPTEDI